MSHSSKHHSRGFTLIELLISISIMTIIVTVIMLNQRNYTDVAILRNTADVLGITLSEAQAYGIAVREREIGSADFASAYGISLTLLESGAQTGYIFFADRNNNLVYDNGWSCPADGSSECKEKIIFPGGAYVESFCILRSSGGDICNNVSRVDISFRRPEPEARLKFFNNGGNEYTPANINGAQIILRSPSGLTRQVKIYTTGQISVQ